MGLSEAQRKLRHRCMTTEALLHKTVSCQAIGLSFAFVTQLKRRIRAESESESAMEAAPVLVLDKHKKE